MTVQKPNVLAEFMLGEQDQLQFVGVRHYSHHPTRISILANRFRTKCSQLIHNTPELTELPEQSRWYCINANLHSHGTYASSFVGKVEQPAQDQLIVLAIECHFYEFLREDILGIWVSSRITRLVLQHAVVHRFERTVFENRLAGKLRFEAGDN